MGGGRRPVRRGRDRVGGAVHAVRPKEGETVVISGAAGGVGSLAVQLARRTGATIVGLASSNAATPAARSSSGPSPLARDYIDQVFNQHNPPKTVSVTWARPA